MTLSSLSLPAALLLFALPSSNPPPQQPPGPGALKFAVTLLAKTEREHRMTEAKLHRLEQIYAQKAQAGQNVAAQLARIKSLRTAHMEQYLKAMEGLGAKFGEDRYAQFRVRMDQGRKRTPENAEAIARKVKAAADKKAGGAGGKK